MTEAAPNNSLDTKKRSDQLKKRVPPGYRFFRKLPYGIAIATLIVLLHLTPFARQIDDRYGLGFLYSLRGPIPPPTGAIVVSIDKQSIDWLRRISAEHDDSAAQLMSCLPPDAIAELERLKGASSLPRPIYTCLLRELKRIRFPVVVFDILFSVPGSDESDKMLAQEMQNHGATVILSGYERFAVEKGGAKLLVEQNKQPLPLFKANAAATGSFLVPRTEGFVPGYIRHVDGFGVTPSLADAAFALVQLESPAPGTGEIQKTKFTYLWLYGPPSAIKTVPIRDILSGATPDDILQSAANTVVFVGACDPSMAVFEDSFPALFRNESDANISGVELVATAFLNLRQGHDLRKLPWPTEIAVLFSFVLALSLFAMIAGAQNVLAIVGLATVYFVTAFVLFLQNRLFLPVAIPIFFVAPIFAVLALVVKSRTAMDLIMRLAPEPIARRMLAQPADDRGKFVTNDATVAFFDVIDSTTIGESLGNLQFGNLMNDFHGIVSQEVKNHGGFVTAFTGDGVTVLFESSTAGTDHALKACHSVISCFHKIRNLNLENANHGLPKLGVRVGMNSGLIGVGGIGAKDRFNFDVVGDAVNVASRLEQLGKTLFPGEREVVLITLAMCQRLQGQDLSFVDCGPQQLPGRKNRENVFRLMVV